MSVSAKVRIRESLRGRYNNRCFYCGLPFSSWLPMTLDHVYPRSRGGANTEANQVPACYPCNRAKGDEVWPSVLAYVGADS